MSYQHPIDVIIAGFYGGLTVVGVIVVSNGLLVVLGA